MALCRRKAKESHTLAKFPVRVNLSERTHGLSKHEAQVELSACMPLIHGETVESRSLGIVLHNT
jgi:hypothetical protein